MRLLIPQQILRIDCSCENDPVEIIVRVGHIDRPSNRVFINCSGVRDQSEKPEFASLLRSDTLMQHQFDPRHRSNFIPTPGQNDDTNRVDLAARTASVDVTGAVSTWEETCFGRSRRNRIGHSVAVFGLSYRHYFDRWYKSDSGHAHMSQLDSSGFVPTSRSSLWLCQWESVVLSTAPSDGNSSPRKSDYQLRQRVGMTQFRTKFLQRRSI